MSKYFPVSLFILRPNKTQDFRVFIKREKNYVLLTNERERFTFDIKVKLANHNITQVYVPEQEAVGYDEYLIKNLGEILNDDEVPVNVKSEIFYNSVTDLSHKLFTDKIPGDQDFLELTNMIEKSIQFLSDLSHLKEISKLINTDYYTYTHSINVFIYTMYLLSLFGYSKKEMTIFGTGAFLHDIGKARIPEDVLNKPGQLSKDSWNIMKKHSEYGFEMCQHLKINPDSLRIIRDHHEKLNGSGYPNGIKNIPQWVSIVTCCDIYDALTTNRVYANARKPFDALKLMQDQMQPELDMQVFKSFILFIGSLKP